MVVTFVSTRNKTITLRRRQFFLFPVKEVWKRGEAYWVTDDRHLPLKLTGEWVFPWYRTSDGREAPPRLRKRLNALWAEFPEK